jgi:hypothetical protein
LKGATVFQLVFGGVLVLGLAAAAVCRSRDAPSSVATTAPSADPAPTLPSDPAPPPLPAPTAASSPVTAQAAPISSTTLDESSLMSELRRIKRSDPNRAAHLAEEGNRRFPDSPDAPERASILVHALSDQGNHSDARRSAEEMVNHYPDSDWVREVELFTGAHRHRNIRINDEGGVEYY